MAKKRKKTTTGRRMGSARGGKNEIMDLILMVGGGVAAAYVPKLLPASMNDKIKAAIPLAAGFLLTRLKNPMLANIGKGMAVGGGVTLIQSTGILTGARMPLLYNSTMPVQRSVGNTFNRLSNVGGVNPVNSFPRPSTVGNSRRRYAGSV